VLRLTILSVLAAWSLLGVIAGGLLMILNALKSVRRHMENIAMGVRAIEQQTAPFGAGVDALGPSLKEAADALSAAAQRLEVVNRDLDAAGPALRRRS
jgi:hypothetical protein